MRHGKGTRVRSAGGDEKAASFFAKKPKESFRLRRATTPVAKSTNERGTSRAGARGELLADRRVSRLVGGGADASCDRVTSRTFMIVAPSFEMVVTPLSSCTSLSKPRGPCAIGRAWSAEIRNQKGGAGDDVRICEPRGDAGTYQGGADGVHHRHARVDVGNQLAFALAGVRALAQEHDLGLLRGTGRGRQPRKAQIAATETKKIWQLAPRRAFERGACPRVSATKRAARREEPPHVRSSARWASA